MKTKTEKFDLVGFIMDLEDGGVDEDRLIDGIQRMVDDGTVWQLQGSYGRLASRLIREGKVTDTHSVLTGQ